MQEGYFTQFDGNVFFGVRTMKDAFFLDELAALPARCGERLRVTVALSDEDVDPAAAGEASAASRFDRGFVHEVAKKTHGRTLRQTCAPTSPVRRPRWTAASASCCWRPSVPADKIRYDKFS